MIQVRCPECGYLQTLSEERFLAISQDYLNCPHCHAQVPKEWNPVDLESVPDEARHKMLAFSRRILNGADVSHDMVYALESLVRRYGQTEESAKALGIGYARLGAPEKAESFLAEAEKQAPEDLEIIRCFLHVRLAQGRYEEAVRAGRALLGLSEGRADDGDIAGLALALIGDEKIPEARELLDSHPDLDPRNPLMREAHRELNRAGMPGIRSLLGRFGPLSRLLGGRARWGSEPLGLHSRDSGDPSPTEPGTSGRQASRPSGYAKSRVGSADVPLTQAVVEYWIYAPNTVVPRWESIKNRLVAMHREEEGESIVDRLESLMDSKDLTVDYISKRDAKELFDYPDELIPRNSRGLNDTDRGILRDAQMIARPRLVLANPTGLDYLALMVKFAEALRAVIGGVVQDAISHTLWGTEEWKRRIVEHPLDDLVESHIQFEILDEGGAVWIHCHGMQKFGLPDIEIDGIPGEFASAGLTMMIMVAETLLKVCEKTRLDVESPIDIANTPFLFRMEVAERDEEAHFPIGSLRILPYVSDYDPYSGDTVKHVLKMVMSRFRRQAHKGRKSEAPARSPQAQENAGLKERLLDAHNRAISELAAFKKSFQEAESSDDVHAVKIGFPVQGGKYEWMWVSLDAWSGASIVGRLENTPILRKDLSKGSKVRIREQDIFDWAISHRGGIVKGAFTEEAMPSH